MESDRESQFEAALFRVAPSDYSGPYDSHFLEEYKLYVQTHEGVSERRDGANKYFLTLNTAIVGIMGLWKEARPNTLIIVGVCLAAITVCVYWRSALSSYGRLNAAKFKVIQAIERRLPLATYEAEWLALGEGTNSLLYKPVSQVERGIPLVFSLLYLLIIAASIWGAA